MRVGFWNVQRLGNPNPTTERSGARWGFGEATLDAWFRVGEPLEAPRPDVVVLAEVSQNGGQWAAMIQQRWGNALGYTATYVEVGDSVGGVSPCSFMVIARGHPQIISVGSLRRPMIQVIFQNKVIAATHIIANRSKSLEEIFTACAELATSHQPAILIGDMNFPFTAPLDVGGAIAQMGFVRVHPMLQATYNGRDVLDYAWPGPGITNVQAHPPEPRYAEWDFIDHAPIEYVIN